MIRSRFAIAAIGAAVVGCSESPTQPIDKSLHEIQSFNCVANVTSNDVSCAPANSSSGPGRSVQQIIGGQNVFVKVRTSNVAYDGTTFSFDTSIQNYTDQQFSTANGTSAHPGGVKIFFNSGPTVTGGSGSIVVANPSGTATFTAASQPYYQYGGLENSALGSDGILDPAETSSTLNWQLTMPNTVTSFAFTLLVTTQMPSATFNSQPPI